MFYGSGSGSGSGSAAESSLRPVVADAHQSDGALPLPFLQAQAAHRDGTSRSPLESAAVIAAASSARGGVGYKRSAETPADAQRSAAAGLADEATDRRSAAKRSRHAGSKAGVPSGK